MSEYLTAAQLDQIEHLAKEATPGPWELIGGGEYVSGPDVIVEHEDSGVSVRDAPYIAAMDPPTTLQLVAEVKELRARVAQLEKSHIDVTTLSCSECYAGWDYIEVDGERAAP